MVVTLIKSRNMKRRIGVQFAMLAILLQIVCLQIQAQNEGKLVTKKLTVAERTARKQQKEREKKMEIMSYYGLSDSQYKEYLRIEGLKRNKINTIRQMNLSREVRKIRVTPILDENRRLLKQFFTPAQYILYEARVKKYQEMKAKENTCIKAYKKERRTLLLLPKKERRKAIRALNSKYIRDMSMFMSPETAKKRILDTDYFTLANNKIIKSLKLPKRKVIALGQVFEKKELRLERINAKKLPRAERKKRMQTLKNWERDRCSKIMGAKKYAVYAAWQNSSHERKCKTQFGFTDADYLAYKRIENNFAIEVMTIKKSRIQPVEKKQKIAMAKEKKIITLRKVLPAGTFEKWYKNYQERMVNSAKSNI